MTLNITSNRLELTVDDHIVFADYRLDGSTLYIDHVEAPEALRGKGAAGKLMQEIVNYAKEQSLEIVPICGYAASWLQHQMPRSR